MYFISYLSSFSFFFSHLPLVLLVLLASQHKDIELFYIYTHTHLVILNKTLQRRELGLLNPLPRLQLIQRGLARAHVHKQLDVVAHGVRASGKAGQHVVVGVL